MVADPATGAWIADPYNLDPSSPFEVVGGTSLSSPAWAGLVALVNQGRVAAGESTLNSSGPTEAQQALYSLPQSDYNVISSGNNGYSANPGYNLVTGLGTPVANRLVPDLVAYQGPGTTYSGPTVGPLQDATLSNTGTTGGGAMDVFSVFDALAVTGDFGVPRNRAPDAGVADRTPTTQDPNILEPPDGPDPQTAVGFRPLTPTVIVPVAPGTQTVAADGIALMPLDGTTAARDAVPSGRSRSGASASRRVTVPRPGLSKSLAVPGGRRITVFNARLIDSALDDLGSKRSLLSRT